MNHFSRKHDLTIVQFRLPFEHSSVTYGTDIGEYDLCVQIQPASENGLQTSLQPKDHDHGDTEKEVAHPRRIIGHD